MLRDDLLEHVPDLGHHRLDVLLGRLDVLGGLPLDEPAHDERLEELERHQLGQAALVQPELRAGHGASAAAVVEQCVDRLLEHPLLVVDDDLRRPEVEQALQPVVPVDDAPVEVVEVARREAAAVELHHRAELWRDHGDGLEDHPLGPVRRDDERVDDLQPLDRPLLLLTLGGADRLAERPGLLVEVEILEQVADRLGAHTAAEVDAEPVRGAEPLLQLAEDLLVVDDQLRLELAEQPPRLLEPAHGVDGRVARVLPARLDVEVHLAHLQRPLHDGVEILLLDLPIRPQAEVVRELAHGGGVRVGRHLLEHLAEEAVAELARPLDLLLVDVRNDLGVVARELVAVQLRVGDPLDALRDGALLRPGGLLHLLAERRKRVPDLHRSLRDLVELSRRQPAVVADGGVPDELADLLRVLGRDLLGEVGDHAAKQIAGLRQRRQPLLLGPVGEAARPEVVVLVEVALLAAREVVPPALQPLLERRELLVAIDVDLLRRALDLLLELVQVALALLDVDVRDDRRGEVQDLLELARRDVEQVADAARHALEEPDVRDGRREVDVAHAFPPDLLARHLDAAALADDALVADALVLPAVALPVPSRTEDALAEEPVALRLQGPVVDGLGLRDLARGPVADLLAGRKPDPDGIEVIDVDQVGVPFALALDRIPARADSGGRTAAASAARSGRPSRAFAVRGGFTHP